MKIFTASQLRELDAYTIDNEPIASIDLMERAGTACTMWLSEYIQPEQRTAIVCGMGNNGGDGVKMVGSQFRSGSNCLISNKGFNREFRGYSSYHIKPYTSFHKGDKVGSQA